MNEKFTFFWSGPFSQWHASNFVVDGVKYTHAEQYMMAEKARLFKDDATLAKIMLATNPEYQKSLGREVANFNAEAWDAVKFSVVFIGNFHKFSQNADLKQVLIDTGETTLVEASPYDRIWGIGLRASDERAKSRDKWLGENYLGRVLDAVRAYINSVDFMAKKKLNSGFVDGIL